MIWTILEVISVACGITGAAMTTSTKPRIRASGFLTFMVGSCCSILIYQQAGLYVMLLQSCVFMVINVRGIHNNLSIGTHHGNSNI